MFLSVRLGSLVREERLVFSDDSPVGLPCESCGVTIKTGRFCDKCKAELATGFRHAAGQDKDRHRSRHQEKASRIAVCAFR